MNWKLQRKINTILGCNIFDHDLVLGHLPTKAAIKACTNIKQVNEILHQRQLELAGKPLSLPGNRYLYWKYIGENHPDFVAL